MIEDGSIVAAGFLANGASQPALANAGRTDQGEIVVGVDPIALGELLSMAPRFSSKVAAQNSPVWRAVAISR